MYTDQFERRVAIAQHRFATTLSSKIENTTVSADHMNRSAMHDDVHRYAPQLLDIGRPNNLRLCDLEFNRKT